MIPRNKILTLLLAAGIAGASSVMTAEDADASAAPELSRDEIMDQALERINEIQEFLQFHELFPEARFVLDNASTHDAPRVEGRALLNGRYSFNIGIDFIVSPEGALEPAGWVDFELQEIKRVRKKDGGVYAEYENEWTISAEEFTRLLESGGDFAPLGYELKADDPVRFVDRYWAMMGQG